MLRLVLALATTFLLGTANQDGQSSEPVSLSRDQILPEPKAEVTNYSTQYGRENMEHVIPTQGKVWPKPQMERTRKTYLVVRPGSFK